MTMEVEPVSGTVGAMVQGVDLSEPLSEATVAAIRQAFLDFHVLFFRDQDLSPEAQLRFGRCFGELVYAVDVPPFGGDTLFASQHAAYEALSDTMKGLLDGLVARHSAGPQYARGGYSTLSKAMKTKSAEHADRIVRHPLVRTHPETGRKALYVNRAFTVGIEGMRMDESMALLEFLFDHAVREPFTCRFRWSAGSVAMWDNRSVQHYALYDYRGHRRHMRRITVKGDRPR